MAPFGASRCTSSGPGLLSGGSGRAADSLLHVRLDGYALAPSAKIEAISISSSARRKSCASGVGCDRRVALRRAPASTSSDGHIAVTCQQQLLGPDSVFKFYPLGVAAITRSTARNRKAKRMATMTVPRALVEDTAEAVPLYGGDVETGGDGYGTFDHGDAKASQQGGTYQGVSDKSTSYSQWDYLTARLADSATAAFLLLQLPQISLNTQNLLAGNYVALFAIPWMGQLTGLLGNLSLLSYFAGKKERGAMVVQAVGVVSTLVVLMQLAIAGAMPRAAFSVTATAVAIGLSLNFFNYKGLLSPKVWRLWEEAVSVGGITILPQVMWSTFQPYLPPSMLPAILFGGSAVTFVVLGRLGKLPDKLVNFMGSVSAWTATLLFMWAPVSQMWLNFLNPANIKGLSVFTVLLAMIGNGLLLPRAIFTRDLMWSTGAAWGFFFQGWAILLSMYMYSSIGDPVFWGVSAGAGIWISGVLIRDSRASDLPTPFSSANDLLFGSSKIRDLK